MNTRSTNPHTSPITVGFSLLRGSRFRKVLQRLGIFQQSNAVARVIILLGLTWLPIALLSSVEGTAWGHSVNIPLYYDFSVYARFFVALPLLIVAESVIDPLIRQATSTLNSSGIIKPANIPEFHVIIAKIARLRDSGFVDALLALLSLVPYFLLFADYQWESNRISTWHGTTQHGLTLAGWWFTVAASPLVRFLMLHWLWRAGLWSSLLWYISRLDLDLLPTHPDRLGGLGFLLSVQKQFGILAAALGSVVAGQFANEILHFGEKYRVMVAPMGVFVALSVILTLLPLTFFSRKLFKAHHDGLLRYSVAGRRVTHRFDIKWIRGLGSPPESMLGTQDPSSLIDYISSYDVISKTRIIPVTKGAVMYVAVLAAAPFAFVWVLATPLEKVIEEILKRML